MFGMDIFTDKAKQEKLAQMAQEVVKAIADTNRLARENNAMLKKLLKEA